MNGLIAIVLRATRASHSEATTAAQRHPPSRCQGTTSGGVLSFMGHNYARDNVRKRAGRRKKAQRLAAAKKNKKKTAK